MLLKLKYYKNNYSRETIASQFFSAVIISLAVVYFIPDLKLTGNISWVSRVSYHKPRAFKNHEFSYSNNCETNIFTLFLYFIIILFYLNESKQNCFSAEQILFNINLIHYLRIFIHIYLKINEVVVWVLICTEGSENSSLSTTTSRM